MSTPSKKRRRAREWMQREVKERAKLVAEEGGRQFREGSRRMRDDMMALLAETEGASEDPADPRRVVVRQIIGRFPDPREHGPYFRVPMPEVPFRLDALDSRHVVPQQYRVVDFQPVRHRIEHAGPGGRAILSWFTWEPTRGSEEVGQRRKVMFDGRGKLSYAANLIRAHLMRHPSGDVARAGALVEECAEELRRVLGDFAPEVVYTEAEREYRMMRGAW